MTRKSLGAKAQNFRKSEVLKLKEIFDSHDKDGGGDVCCTELLADTSTSFSKTCESSNMKLEYAKSVFAQLDVNGDSRITFQEYLTHCYPRATMLERSQMLDWVTNKSERPETPPVEIMQSADSAAVIKQALVASRLSCTTPKSRTFMFSFFKNPFNK